MAGKPVTRQQLDTDLGNVAILLRNVFSSSEILTILARFLAQTTQAQLEDTAGEFAYPTADAYAIKLFGDYLTQFANAARGAALPALDPPLLGTGTTAGLADQFTGLD